MKFKDDSEWAQLSPEEKKKQLYLKQVKTLNDFLERNAISKEQYEKSLHELTEKVNRKMRSPILSDRIMFIGLPGEIQWRDRSSENRTSIMLFLFSEVGGIRGSDRTSIYPRKTKT